MTPVLKDETQFLAWGDGPQGPWIKLKLRDSEDLGPFRGMTAAKATQAGQRLACVLVEIGENEQPKEPQAPTQPWVPKGGELAKLAGIFCATAEFQEWAGVDTEEAAAAWLRDTCGIKSRAELDHDHGAAVLFHNLIRKPWLAHQGAA